MVASGEGVEGAGEGAAPKTWDRLAGPGAIKVYYTKSDILK